jgi:hypothetical protein
MRASDRRQLSSRKTFFYKCIFPAIWISGFVATTAGIFAGVFRDQNGNPVSMDMGWAFLAATVAGAIFLYWTCVRLKVVWLQNGLLCVSNYLRTEQIPLVDIAEVEERRWSSNHPIIVRFVHETYFGTAIVFIPQPRWVVLRPHPIAEELRAAVVAAGRHGQ